MFGIGKKRDEKEWAIVREVVNRQDVIERMGRQFVDMTDKMSQMWMEAEESFSELGRSQYELDRQLGQASERIAHGFGASLEQNESRRQLAERAGEVAEQLQKSKMQREEIFQKLHEKEAQMEQKMSQAEELDCMQEAAAQISLEVRQDIDGLKDTVGQAQELGRQMGVVSLNAAIEAGRMGEEGIKFVEAAEEVRDLSGKYQELVSTLFDRIKETDEKWRQALKQIEKSEQDKKERFIGIGQAKDDWMKTAQKLMEQEQEESTAADFLQEAEQFLGAQMQEEQDHPAFEIMEQAKDSFEKQQEILNQLRRTAAEARVLIKNSLTDGGRT